MRDFFKLHLSSNWGRGLFSFLTHWVLLLLLSAFLYMLKESCKSSNNGWTRQDPDVVVAVIRKLNTPSSQFLSVFLCFLKWLLFLMPLIMMALVCFGNCKIANLKDTDRIVGNLISHVYPSLLVGMHEWHQSRLQKWIRWKLQHFDLPFLMEVQTSAWKGRFHQIQ